MKRGLFDVQSKALEPIWLRIAIVVACFVWAGFELRNGAQIWALVFAAAGIYLGYQFFVVWDPRKRDEEDET